MMSSSLGSNLSELDRLLLELNAVQHNTPGGFLADDASQSPPLPGAPGSHYGIPENSSPPGGKATPPTKEKPKRNNGNRGPEEARPSVETLLDELESSVPSPVPAITVNQGEVVPSSQQQTRISASSATRELDELMASLSDFKRGRGGLREGAGASCYAHAGRAERGLGSAGIPGPRGLPNSSFSPVQKPLALCLGFSLHRFSSPLTSGAVGAHARVTVVLDCHGRLPPARIQSRQSRSSPLLSAGAFLFLLLQPGSPLSLSSERPPEPLRRAPPPGSLGARPAPLLSSSPLPPAQPPSSSPCRGSPCPCVKGRGTSPPSSGRASGTPARPQPLGWPQLGAESAAATAEKPPGVSFMEDRLTPFGAEDWGKDPTKGALDGADGLPGATLSQPLTPAGVSGGSRLPGPPSGGRAGPPLPDKATAAARDRLGTPERQPPTGAAPGPRDPPDPAVVATDHQGVFPNLYGRRPDGGTGSRDSAGGESSPGRGGTGGPGRGAREAGRDVLEQLPALEMSGTERISTSGQAGAGVGPGERGVAAHPLRMAGWGGAPVLRARGIPPVPAEATGKRPGSWHGPGDVAGSARSPEGHWALRGSLCAPLLGMDSPSSPFCFSSFSLSAGAPVTGRPLVAQIRSVIQRSRQTAHAHPMSREAWPRRRPGRRPGPVILQQTPSQDRLISELRGRLGLGPAEEVAADAGGPEAWLTEGVVITVQPRGRQDGGQLIEKVVGGQTRPGPAPGWEETAGREWRPAGEGLGTKAQGSPATLGLGDPRAQIWAGPRKGPCSLPLENCGQGRSYREAPESSPGRAGPPLRPTSPPGPSSAPRSGPPGRRRRDSPRAEKTGSPPPEGPAAPRPPPAPAAPSSVTSVGCQTDADPLFPPMQFIPFPPWKMQELEPREAGGDASWLPNGRQSCEGRAEGVFMAQGKAGSGSPPGGPPKPGSQLDSMLGSLQSDLNKLGVATVAKGVCGACKKPIAGQVVTAMGKTWHPEHFVCTHCQEEIGSRNFFERDGQPYCEKDYHNLFSPRCYYCNGPILDKVVTALDRTWHPEHFFCAQCGAFFGPEGFHEKDGKAYCRKDYFDMFAPKCGGCARAILENYISALNTLWHPECFVCRECFTPFINGSFFEHAGQPYCEVHYHERRGSLCSGCQKPITGRCITAMAKKFHPEHFVCAFCLKQLNKGTFKEQNDKPYCQNCFLKLFC
ncbi:paxillin [Tachyglossus aculeatus]|uniref:paxillin n=1 Tax=Tachyglossus aculeatus TaxID=9261 RepID=UPI0018F336F8|nr:paxillin [Tachyglossus aculeatus]